MSTHAPKPTTSRRNVITSGLVPRHGRPRLWAYGYADLAKLFGISEGAVRQLVAAKRFEPSSLASIVEYSARLGAKRVG